jgi:hypothetical protein
MSERRLNDLDDAKPVRRMTLEISSTLFPAFFGSGEKHYEVTKDALPDDTRVINAMMDPQCRYVVLLLESESFPETTTGNVYPPLCPMMRDLRTTKFAIETK